MSSFCFACNNIGNSLCLSKVHFAIKECSLGEFSRLRIPATIRNQQLKNLGHYVGRAVGVYLHHILASI